MKKKKSESGIEYQDNVTWIANKLTLPRELPTEKEIKVRVHEDVKGVIPEGNKQIPTESKTEYQIKSVFEDIQSDLYSTYESGLNRCKDHIKFLEVSKNEVDKEGLIREIKNLAIQTIKKAGITAKEKYIQFLKARESLQRFRLNHDREDYAKYPESKFFAFSLVFFFLFLETMINGAAFREIDGGFAGGVIQAFLFSLINIILAIGQGTSWRFLIYQNLRRSVKEKLFKILGWLLSIITGIAAIFWNLYVAHYRDIATAKIKKGVYVDQLTGDFATGEIVALDPNKYIVITEDPYETAWHKLISINETFSLDNLEAWGLLFFGLGIFLIIAKDVYSGFSDPFFGYEDVDKTHNTKNKEWDEEKHKVREQLEEEIEKEIQEHLMELAREKEKINHQKESYNNLRHFINNLHDSISSHLYESKKLLGVYRKLYIDIKGQNSSRKHFNVYPERKEFNSKKHFDEIEQVIKSSEVNHKYNEKQIQDLLTKVEETKIDIIDQTSDDFFEDIKIKAEKDYLEMKHEKKEELEND